MKLFILIALIFGLSLSRTASSKTETEAIKKTQESLKDKKKRQELLKTPEAQKANDSALGVMGSEQNLEEAYSIAAELLPVLMEMNDNDPEKAAKSLELFQKNPEKFMESIPEKSKDRIKLLAEKIQNESKKKP